MKLYKTVVLPANPVGGRHILTQSMMSAPNTRYVVEREYYIDSVVKIPVDSEVVVNTGFVAGRSMYFTGGDFSVTPKSYVNVLELTGSGGPDLDRPYLMPGSRVRNGMDYKFEMHLTGECRVLLPSYGGEDQDGSLIITSNRENSIQIDGSTTLEFMARDCKFQRVFYSDSGWAFVNRTEGTFKSVLIDNCVIWAEAFAGDVSKCKSSFFSLAAKVILKSGKGVAEKVSGIPMTTHYRLLVTNSIIDNVGLEGEMISENNVFDFGLNLSSNHETIHCGSHSRITNCVFDGGAASGNAVPLKSDVIDVFNGHDIVISGCTFRDFITKGQVGRNMITIKSHYNLNSTVDENNPLPNDSHVIGQQVGVTVNNCFFDMPEFTGTLIEVWNGVRDGETDLPYYNRQLTLLENNVFNAPKSTAFVYCKRFTDRLTVRGNSGYVKVLVFVPAHYKFDPDQNIGQDEAPNQWARDLVIDNNTLVGYYSVKDDEVWYEDDGLTILYGWTFKGVSLTNNRTRGYLWNGMSKGHQRYITGTIRVENNETYGSRGLFRNDQSGIASFKKDTPVFFSGNVSRGKPTDLGTASTCLDPSDVGFQW